MYRIIDNRSTGKTSRLILLAKETNSIIACANPNAMYQKALGYGIVGIDFIHYDEINKEEYKDKNIMIDEAELFLKHLCKNNNLVGYTLSMEN